MRRYGVLTAMILVLIAIVTVHASGPAVPAVEETGREKVVIEIIVTADRELFQAGDLSGFTPLRDVQTLSPDLERVDARYNAIAVRRAFAIPKDGGVRVTYVIRLETSAPAAEIAGAYAGLDGVKHTEINRTVRTHEDGGTR